MSINNSRHNSTNKQLCPNSFPFFDGSEEILHCTSHHFSILTYIIDVMMWKRKQMLNPIKLPFGEQIVSARNMRNWSRAKLARETGISENSLTRYEKAGVDETGQYPIGQNLALLVFLLELDPKDALLGCLKDEDFERFSGNDPKAAYGYPLYRTLAEEHLVCVHDNAKLKSLVRVLLSEKEEKIQIRESDLEFIKKEFYSISKQVFVEDEIFYVDDETDDEDIDNHFKTNDPDQNEPGR